MYLDVFEDTIYFTTYLNHQVLTMSKFGNGTVTPVMEPLPYAATITVWHSSREKTGEYSSFTPALLVNCEALL